MAGGEGPDLFYLDGSGQTLVGGTGCDTYVAGRAIGRDVIDDAEPFGSSRCVDTLRFAAHAAPEIAASRDGLDLVLTVRATGETITVRRQFEGEFPGGMISDITDDTGVGEIVFADGTVWTGLDMAHAVRRVDPAGSVVAGTPDNDVLAGGGDGDLYVIGRDVIQDRQGNLLSGGEDTLRFTPEVRPDEVEVAREGGGDSFTLAIRGSGDRVTLRNQYTGMATGVFGVLFPDRVATLCTHLEKPFRIGGLT